MMKIKTPTIHIILNKQMKPKKMQLKNYYQRTIIALLILIKSENMEVERSVLDNLSL